MLQPATEADLAEAVKTATGPLRVVGGGTRDIGDGQQQTYTHQHPQQEQLYL